MAFNFGPFGGGSPAPLASGPPPAQVPTKRSALSLAVESNSVEAVRALLAAGASPSATDYLGNTPLHYLFPQSGIRGFGGPSAQEVDEREAKALAICAALASAGADMDAPNAQGLTPLARLVSNGLLERSELSEPAVRALCAAGASATCRLGLDEGNNSNPKPTVLKRLLESVRTGLFGGSGNTESARKCILTLLEFGAARGGDDEDLLTEALTKGELAIARQLLAQLTPPPSAQALLEKVRAVAQAQAAPRAAGGFNFGGGGGGGGGFGGLVSPTPNENNANNANSAEGAGPAPPPPFTQMDLVTCVRLNFPPAIRALLEPAAQPPLDVNSRPDGGSAETPLREAVKNDCAEAMTQLLDLGAASPQTALAAAITSQSRACLAALLARPGFSVAEPIPASAPAAAASFAFGQHPSSSPFGQQQSSTPAAATTTTTTTTTTTALHLAIEAEDAGTVAALAALPGANLEARNHKGHTCLHTAIGTRRLSLLRTLLDLGADAAAAGGSTALHLAVRASSASGRSWVEGVGLLLERGASVAAVDSRGATALCCAARSGCLQAAVLLLARGASPNARSGAARCTPVLRAARAGHAAVLRALAAAGGDVSAAAGAAGEGLLLGATPLHAACAGLHLEAATALCQLGAEVAAALPEQPASAAAARAARPALPPPSSGLFGASMAALRAVAAAEAPPYAAGQTALTAACMLDTAAHGGLFGSSSFSGMGDSAVAAKLVALLVRHGAPVDSVDSTGRTALLHAAQLKGEEAAAAVGQALLSAGASVGAEDAQGCTALHHASRLLHRRLVLALCRAGASARGAPGVPSPLMLAVKASARSQFTFGGGGGGARVLGGGADTTAAELFEEEALPADRRLAIIEALIKAGANVKETEEVGAAPEPAPTAAAPAFGGFNFGKAASTTKGTPSAAAAAAPSSAFSSGFGSAAAPVAAVAAAAAAPLASGGFGLAAAPVAAVAAAAAAPSLPFGTATGGFGSTAAAPAAANAFSFNFNSGSASSASSAKPSAFSFSSAAPSSVFGGAPTAAAPSMFGGAPTAAAATPSFGAAFAAPAAAAPSNIFGSATATTGFGSAFPAAAATTFGGAFPAAAAATGFGGAFPAAAATTVFGGTPAAAAAATGFGGAPTAAAAAAAPFGARTAAASLFGATTASAAAPPSDPLTSPQGLASIALNRGSGSEEVARRLVELGAPVTDFFTAAYLGLTEPLAALLAAGEDVEARTLGLTPLMWACKRNNADCVTALLALGASAAAEDATLAAVEEEDN